MKKHLKITFTSPTIIVYVALCLLATGLNYLTEGDSQHLVFSSYRSALVDPLTYLRFFTHIFGHNNWAHLIGNSAYLLLLGPALEEKYGAGRITLSLLITAILSSLINFIFFPSNVICGASGVVCAFILMTSFIGFRDMEIPITSILVFIIYIGQQIYEMVTIHSNISNLSYIIAGLVASIISCFVVRSRKRYK